ncbi:LicD family protein [Candidatus Saccharibacteria bacterium TM7i]|nr:LicD family protein [Candidatus Saccharibacteria bacterium TM7i]
MTDLQVKLLDIYREIKRICEKYNITYYADGGTKLGAVRHGGFIPWDDDMDIAMKLDDYNVFKKVARKELADSYELLDGSSIDHVDFSFLKISDKTTTFIRWEDLPFSENYMGVHIDVFPYVGTDSSRSESAFNKKLDLLIDEITSKKLYGIGRELPILFKEQKELQQRFRLKESRYVRNGTTSMWRDSAIFPTSGYENSVEIPFEDTVIPLPGGFERQLKIQYGDYMKFPPKNERVSHHFGFVDLNTPYTHYQKESRQHFVSEVIKYTHTLQISKYQAERRLIEQEEKSAEEMKHKEYFISEAERKYTEAQKELNSIYNSRAWKVVTQLRKMSK